MEETQERIPLLAPERRGSFWLAFQVLLQRFRDVLWFGGTGPTEQERLQLELNVYKAELDAMRRTAEEAEMHKRTMEEAKARSQNQVAELTEELDAATETRRQLQDELHNHEVARTEYEQESKVLVSQLSAELEVAQGRVEELQREEKSYHDRVNDLESRLKDARAELEVEQRRSKELHDTEQSQRNRIADLVGTLKDLQRELGNAQRNSEELQALMKDQEAAQEAAINSKSREVLDTQRRADELQRQLDSNVAKLRSALQVLKIQEPVGEDEALKNMILAIEDALPSAIPPMPEDPLDDSTRDAYESLVDKIDALHQRMGGALPKGPNRKKTGASSKKAVKHLEPVEAMEYVQSTLHVALPQLSFGQRKRIKVRPPINSSERKGTRQPAQTEDSTASDTSSSEGDWHQPGGEPGPEEPKPRDTWPRQLYENSRLDASSIRLVDILPGASEDPDDMINVRFGVYTLNEVARQYEALSYVCGPEKPTKDIIVNDVEVPIGMNLYHALLWLRKPDSKRRVWIDSISINQQSINQKSKEVQRMGPVSHGLFIDFLCHCSNWDHDLF
jgi:hypothetical protein